MIDFGISGAIAAFFIKLSSLLDVFDLSFFISGAINLMCIMFLLDLFNISSFSNLDYLIKVFLFIISCYALGLISFSIGRLVRKGIFGKYICIYDIYSNKGPLQQNLLDLMKVHSLDEMSIFKNYDAINDRYAALCLYQRLWAEVRQSMQLVPSYNMLNKWWSMAATYDGIGIGLIFWAITIVIIKIGLIQINDTCYSNLFCSQIIYFILLLLLLTSVVCFREAGNLEWNQLRELVATIAYKYNSSDDGS